MNRNSMGTLRVPAGAPTDDLAIVRMADGFVLGQPILRADVAGMPLEWVDYKEAARLYTQGQVAYSVGTPLYQLKGGFNAATGRRSVLELNSIIATIGTTANPGNTRHDYIPPLNNQTLFRRDGYLCLYCAQRFTSTDLSRDHIRPFSQGGRDTWNNVVTACRRCNNAKASRTPEQAKMQLIAVPFTPTYAPGCWTTRRCRPPRRTSVPNRRRVRAPSRKAMVAPRPRRRASESWTSRCWSR
jgi:hypothetical protein